MITVEVLEKQLKNNQIQPLYLLYGEELFLLESNLKKIMNLFGEVVKGINYIQIDDTNYQTLIAELETPAFGYEKKLIVARNTKLVGKDGRKKNIELSNTREKVKAFIEENIEMINQNVILIFVEEDIDSRLGITKTIQKLGTCCKFDYQKPQQIIKRMKAICNAYKVNIDDATLRYFIECCGTNMQELINEIRKLIEYAGENGTIQKKDIEQLSTRKLESIIFDLTDNLGKKETAKSLEILENLIFAKEPLQKILITLYNHFKKIYLVKLAVKYNKDIVSSLNLKPNQSFLTTKYKMQAGYFGEIELKEILQKLRDLDYEYKNGLIDLQIGLETILCKYCSKGA